MKYFLFAAITLLLGGCGWLTGREGLLRDRAHEYLTARTEPRLTLPEGVPPNTQEQDYLTIPSLPEQSQGALPEEFEIPTPPPLLAEQADATGGENVSLNQMQAMGEEGVIADKYRAELFNGEDEKAALRMSAEFEEAWDAVGQSFAISQTEVIDLDRSKGIYYIKVEDVTVKVNVKEAGNGVVLVTVEEDVETVTEETRKVVLTTVKEKLPR